MPVSMGLRRAVRGRGSDPGTSGLRPRPRHGRPCLSYPIELWRLRATLAPPSGSDAESTVPCTRLVPCPGGQAPCGLSGTVWAALVSDSRVGRGRRHSCGNFFNHAAPIRLSCPLDGHHALAHRPALAHSVTERVVRSSSLPEQ